MLAALSLALAAGAALPPALTLDDALAEAARASGDLELARTQALAAGADVYGSYAGVLPRLDLSAGFGHDFVGARSSVAAFPTRIDPATGQPVFEQRVVAIPPTDNPDYSLGLTLQLPIFDGGRSWRTIRRAEAAERGAARSLDEATLTVAFEVTRRFYEVVKAQESLRVLEETVARSAEIVRRAEALFEAGRGSRADVLTARGNLGNDRVSVEQQRARVAQTQADLAQAIGRDLAEPFTAVPPSELARAARPAEEEPPDLAALVALARRERPLLASQAEAVRASELGEDVARGAYSPVVSAQASYNRQGPTFSGRDGVYGDPSRQYVANAGVVVQWNLFNGRQTAADAQRAALATRRARVQAAQAGQQVAAEIARARASVVALARAAAIAVDNLALAEQGVSLAKERLLAGAASQLEVRDANLKLTQAQLQLVEARDDHAVARADLRRAVGGRL
jgi:outer membrane protein